MSPLGTRHASRRDLLQVRVSARLCHERVRSREPRVYDPASGSIGQSIALVSGRDSRQLPVAGVTPHPHVQWMMQVARHSTMEAWGCLSVGQSLLHDREGQYGPVLQQNIAAAGVTRGPLPPRSPHCNASAERWVRSVTEACLARWIRCGEASLPHALVQ